MQGIKHKSPLHDWKITVRSFQSKTHFSAGNTLTHCHLLANGGQIIGVWLEATCLFCFICLTLYSSLSPDYFLREIFPLLNEEIRLIFITE